VVPQTRQMLKKGAVTAPFSKHFSKIFKRHRGLEGEN
jgi:hypothetical protein